MIKLKPNKIKLDVLWAKILLLKKEERKISVLRKVFHTTKLNQLKYI